MHEKKKEIIIKKLATEEMELYEQERKLYPFHTEVQNTKEENRIDQL